MLRRIVVTWVLVFALAPCALAGSSFKSGKDLYIGLTSRIPYEIGAAYGYIEGVVDALDGTLFTLPLDVSMRQAAEAVTLYLANHPDENNMDAVVLVTNALTEAYPLKKHR